jgi:hypothetical protein
MSSYLGHAPAKALHPWPPANYLTKHEVDLTWNWQRLATWYGRQSPKDIIYYNFQSYDPDVINYELYHKVGCRVKTADQKNYRFGVSDPPQASDPKLYIYIPHGGWSPPDQNDAMAEELVLNTLYQWQAHVSVRFDGIGITSSDISGIADLIAVSKKISVRYRNPIPYAPPDVAAAYIYDLNQLFVRHTTTSSIKNRAAIVHEAAHAVLDKRGLPMSLITSEAIGMVAGSLAAMNWGAHTRPTGAIAGPAWDVALAIRNNAPREAVDRALRQAIYDNPVYRAQILLGKHPTYNGV